MNLTFQYLVRARPGQLGLAMRVVPDKLFAVEAHRIIDSVTPFTESRHRAFLLPRTMPSCCAWSARCCWR